MPLRSAPLTSSRNCRWRVWVRNACGGAFFPLFFPLSILHWVLFWWFFRWFWMVLKGGFFSSHICRNLWTNTSTWLDKNLSFWVKDLKRFKWLGSFVGRWGWNSIISDRFADAVGKFWREAGKQIWYDLCQIFFKENTNLQHFELCWCKLVSLELHVVPFLIHVCHWCPPWHQLTLVRFWDDPKLGPFKLNGWCEDSFGTPLLLEIYQFQRSI